VDEKSLAHFLSLIGQYYALKGGDLLLSIQYSEDAFKEAEKINDIDLMAPVGADLVMLYFWMGEYVKVTDIASKVIALLEKSQRQADFFGRPYNVYSFLHAEHATCSWRLGNFKEGEALFEKGLDFALKIKDIFSLAVSELHHGFDFDFKGDAKAAIEHLQNSIRYCEEGNLVIILGPAWIALGWAYWLLGELETARKHMEKGLKIKIDTGIHFDLGFFYGCSVLVYMDLGDLKKAHRRAEEALEIAQKNHEKTGEGLAWIVLGRVLAKVDQSQDDKAEEFVLKGIKVYEELKMKHFYAYGYLFLGELYTDKGQKDKALETLSYWLAKTHEIQEKL
jgi:tetratricopeptide (TPR) repeat protein